MKYGNKFSEYFGAGLGLDAGLGECTVRESCTSYTASPFFDMSFYLNDSAITLTVYRRYTWLEFGPDSFNLNIYGDDNYMISFSQKIDFDRKQNTEL